MKAGGVCIGCTMPGFPDKFAPFYKTPPGAIVSTVCRAGVGAVMRRLRRLSIREGQSRASMGRRSTTCPAAGATAQRTTVMDQTIQFFYEKWQHMGSQTPGRPPGEEDRFWGVDRPGVKGDYLTTTASSEERDR